MNFLEYVMRRRSTDDKIGDAARDIRSDYMFPDTNDRQSIVRYVEQQTGACEEAIDAVGQLFDEYSSADLEAAATKPTMEDSRLPVGEAPRAYLPYCIKRNAEGYWQILNRDYQEISPSSKKLLLRLTEEDARALSNKSLDEGYSSIFLYDDGCVPWRCDANMQMYMKKLSYLILIGGVVR